MTEANPHLAELRRRAMALPMTPGVYIMRDKTGEVIYVGKAKALKNRVSQYFGSDQNHTEKVRQMVRRVERFDYILVNSEFEALVLECALIKQYSPKYNILLKDDKGYCYIRISPPPYARITAVRQKADDGARYLGPYMSYHTVRQSVDEACRTFLLPTCDRRLAFGRTSGRPCLDHHIGQCSAPCTGRVSEAEHAERVEQAVELLTGGTAAVTASLTAQMEEAAERLEFEKAARLRDRLAAIRRLQEKQKVVMSRVPQQDILALSGSADKACMEVFRFRGGNLCDREHFLFEPDATPETTRAEFLRRYYSLRDDVPPRVALDGEAEERELLEQWLSEKAGRRVHIVCPQKGEQAQLVELCRQNAAEHLAAQEGRSGRSTAALDELARLLGLPSPPAYIECYDISNQNGTDNVAGMVAFENGQPLRSAYRRFAIRTVVGQDDYGSMREVLSRRMEEYEAHKEEGVGFGRKPDLILLDGGEEHVRVGKPIVDAYGLGIPVFGLVKDGSHRTRAIAADGEEIAIRSNRGVFTLLSTIQEEVHRFAIGYHRQRRRSHVTSTALTSIPGVGEVRARELLRRFGSLTAVRAATVEELLTVKGMDRPTADNIVAWAQKAP